MILKSKTMKINHSQKLHRLKISTYTVFILISRVLKAANNDLGLLRLHLVANVLNSLQHISHSPYIIS